MYNALWASQPPRNSRAPCQKPPNPLTTILVAIARTASVFLHESGKLGDNSFRTERRLAFANYIQDIGLILRCAIAIVMLSFDPPEGSTKAM